MPWWRLSAALGPLGKISELEPGRRRHLASAARSATIPITGLLALIDEPRPNLHARRRIACGGRARDARHQRLCRGRRAARLAVSPTISSCSSPATIFSTAPTPKATTPAAPSSPSAASTSARGCDSEARALCAFACSCLWRSRWRRPGARAAERGAVKAAFLPKFARYVEWPAGVAARRRAQPFQLCVIGRDPFGRLLDQAAAAELIDGRGVTVAACLARRGAAPAAISPSSTARTAPDTARLLLAFAAARSSPSPTRAPARSAA